jgi:hypothetical protein
LAVAGGVTNPMYHVFLKTASHATSASCVQSMQAV